MIKLLIYTFVFLFGSSFCNEQELKTLYYSLDPNSISELLAFHKLYPNSAEGKQAYNDFWQLIYKHRDNMPENTHFLEIPELDISSIMSVVNKQEYEEKNDIPYSSLKAIDNLCSHLKNRSLKGYSIWTKEELVDLKSEEIDLARALMIYQFDGDKNKIKQYEAALDLIALQVLAYLPKDATDRQKVDAISYFIFHEKRFRFPPHSLHVKDIDTYTLLPSVLDSHHGVCLGVSILYLTIAERLGISLKIITPPGHIFLGFENEFESINIETTSRGMDFSDKKYLSISTKSLQRRTKKEVIGLAFINQASVALQKNDYGKTVNLYTQALPFLKNDHVLTTLLGYAHIFNGDEKSGKKFLMKSLTIDDVHSLVKDNTPQDFLNNKVDAEGLKVIFKNVDESRSSIIEKQELLKKTLKKYPNFREGLLQLAITHLQLNQSEKALDVLKSYHNIDNSSCVVEYYLSVVYLRRLCYVDAWKHFKIALEITKKFDYIPKCLQQLKFSLKHLCKDPDEHLLFDHSVINPSKI